ncbi:MAG: DUF1592 domain-containing protein [Nannocystaceae bacterium]|nr:DUF1592 domain-containing protein [Nannocystaceae bacterium]
MLPRSLAAPVVLALSSGCYQGLHAGAVADDAEVGSSSGDPAGSSGDAPDGPPGDCVATSPHVALRTLTRREYANTVRDLLGVTDDLAASFAADEQVAGYDANATQAPSATQIELYLDAAETLAAIAVGSERARFVACAPEQAGCAEAFIEAFGARAFRRPLSPAEQAAYLEDFTAIAGEQDATLGLQVVATAMLASPHFLYLGDRSELGDDTARAWDLASRLSYFLWATMPDDALFDAAATGQLSTRDEVAAQVRRMLDDPRAADALASFSTQWLEVASLVQRAPKDPELFPSWTPTLADAAEREVGTLMHHVVHDGDGSFASLLRSREAWVDDSLAALYGVAAPAGGAGWAMLPEDQRAGLLTRVAFLAGHAHATQGSIVHRGKWVRERLLCTTLPPPPPGAADKPIDEDSRLEDGACKGCHSLMDPIGIGFDGYDAIGGYLGSGSPGRIEGFDPPEFADPIALSELLATAPEAHACFAEQLFAFANRRTVADDEACGVDALAAGFASDGDIVALIVDLATAPAFTGQELP